MSTSVTVQESKNGLEQGPHKPLEEAWPAWVAKGLARDRRGSAARLNALKWVSIVALSAAAGIGSNLVSPYDSVVHLIVVAGALLVMLDAFHRRRFWIAAALAPVAVLFNPVIPLIGFFGDWHLAVVAACAIPFVASIALWKNRRDAK